MDARELYIKLGGDYEEVLSRLGKEERIIKYLNKFLDSSDMQELIKSIDDEDWEAGFRLSHTLKGVAANLGLTGLCEASSVLCESLRTGVKPEGDLGLMMRTVQQHYDASVEAIKALK